MKLKTVQGGKARVATKIKGNTRVKLSGGVTGGGGSAQGPHDGRGLGPQDGRGGRCPGRAGQDEAEGQTPQQEVQLKGLGWSDKDIDNMSAKQIEIILRRKTKRRMKPNSFQGEVDAENTPEQIKKMLEGKLKGAQALYDMLKKVDYTAYNIGDFFESDLPKLRKMGKAVHKAKALLEGHLYRFQRQARDDLKAVGKSASFIEVEGAKGVEGAHHQDGKDWYVDTEFINHSQRVYPGATLRHMGMGEFVLETPDGDVEFDRMRGKKFEGQSGRSHQLYGAEKAVKKLLKLMESKGKSKKI